MAKTKKTVEKITIKQIGSPIRRPSVQRTHLECLGLGKMNAVVELENNKTVQGLIRKARHMIEIIKN